MSKQWKKDLRGAYHRDFGNARKRAKTGQSTKGSKPVSTAKIEHVLVLRRGKRVIEERAA